MAVERLCATLGGRALYRRLFLDPGRFHIRREEVLVPSLPAALEGLRIVQISDIHAGAFLGSGDLRHVVDAVDELAPDLVVLTGDYITHEWGEALAVAQDLVRLAAPLGVFAVFGNHDYKHRQEGRIAEAFSGGGMRFLRNEHVVLQRGGARLGLVGLEDLEEGKAFKAKKKGKGQGKGKEPGNGKKGKGKGKEPGSGKRVQLGEKGKKSLEKGKKGKKGIAKKPGIAKNGLQKGKILKPDSSKGKVKRRPAAASVRSFKK